MSELECLEKIEGLTSARVNGYTRTNRTGRFSISPGLMRAKPARELKKPEPAKVAEKTTVVEVPARPQMDSQPASVEVKFWDYNSVVAAFKTIKDEVQISNDDLDALLSFSRGHTDKLLGPSSVRGFARDSLDAMMWGLCIEGSFTIDLERAKDMQQHWERRCSANTRTKPNRISKKIIALAKPIILRELARKASQARWRKYRSRKEGKST